MTLPRKSAVAAKKASRAAAGHALSVAVKRMSRQKDALGSRDVPRVSVITAGGYTVFGSPVRPAHLTTEQIAEAIAELD